MPVSVLFPHMSMHPFCAWCQRRPEEGVRSSWNWSYEQHRVGPRIEVRYSGGAASALKLLNCLYSLIYLFFETVLYGGFDWPETYYVAHTDINLNLLSVGFMDMDYQAQQYLSLTHKILLSMRNKSFHFYQLISSKFVTSENSSLLYPKLEMVSLLCIYLNS